MGGATGTTGTEALRADLRAALLADPDAPARTLVAILARHGVLRRFLQPTANGGFRYAADWRDALECLAELGGIDLSLARLTEGHLNALQLVSLFGSAAQQARVSAAVSAGGMLGVWGAEGAAPVRLSPPDAAGLRRLSGAKRYASGLGFLPLALVPVDEADGTKALLLLDVSDPARADPSSWNHRGMRRTVSGTFHFDGMTVGPDDVIGAPDDYRREPFFVGGIWRCAAAQLGAIEAIAATIARELRSSGRDANPLQAARIGTTILKSRTARLWIEDAAARVENHRPDRDAAALSRTVALSAFARLATEEAAMAVIDLAERALGLGSFAVGHPTEALTRDLAVYIRQANPDGTLLEHGRTLAEGLLK